MSPISILAIPNASPTVADVATDSPAVPPIDSAGPGNTDQDQLPFEDVLAVFGEATPDIMLVKELPVDSATDNSTSHPLPTSTIRTLARATQRQLPRASKAIQGGIQSVVTKYGFKKEVVERQTSTTLISTPTTTRPSLGQRQEGAENPNLTLDVAALSPLWTRSKDTAHSETSSVAKGSRQIQSLHVQPLPTDNAATLKAKSQPNRAQVPTISAPNNDQVNFVSEVDLQNSDTSLFETHGESPRKIGAARQLGAQAQSIASTTPIARRTGSISNGSLEMQQTPPDIASDSSPEPKTTAAPSPSSEMLDGSFANSVAQQPLENASSTRGAPATLESSVTKQVADHVIAARISDENGQRRIEIKLDPPHLGSISVDVSDMNDRLVAKITAADPVALQALQTNAPNLIETLEQAGIEFDEFSFNQQHQSNERQSEQRDSRPASHFSGGGLESNAEVVPNPVDNRTNQRLDITV